MDYDPEQDNQDDEFDWEQTYGRNGAIFVVDCCSITFREGGTYFRDALRIIRRMIMNGIIANQKDMVGVVLMNVMRSPSEDESALNLYENLGIFLNISHSSKEIVEHLHRTQESENFNDFTAKYGHCDTNSGTFVDAFWLASKMFKSADSKIVEKSIILLTANAVPLPAGSDDEINAFKKAKDLHEAGIDFQLVPLCDEFDLSNFYGQFWEIATGEPLEWDDEINPEKIRETLTGRTICPNWRKRSVGSVKLQVAGDVEVSVQIYTTSRKAKPPQRVYVTKDTNEPIVTKIVHTVSAGNPDNEEETKAVLPGDQLRYVEIGGEEISLTNTEYKKFRELMSPGIKIIGFSSPNTVKLSNHVTAPLFIYPTDDWIQGSVCLFQAIWQQCLQKNKVAIAVMQSRHGSLPKLVALVPQTADLHRLCVKSDGFRVEFLPFTEYIRNLDYLKENDLVKSTPEEIEIMRKILKKLKTKYSPEDFSNPNVSNKFCQIEWEILQNEPQDLDDLTAIDTKMQDERITKLIDVFNETFVGDEALAEKRKATTSDGRPKAKVQKANEPVDVVDSYKKGNLEKLSVDNLKQFLTDGGYKSLSKYKKKELIEKVEQHIQENMMDIS